MNGANQTMKQLLTFLSLLLLIQLQDVSAAPAEDTIRDTSQKVLQRLDNERNKLKLNPEYLQVLVRELIIPQFDFHKMSRLVLGKRWHKLDNRSQTCFSQGFSNVLMERYADILLSYDNQTITYEPAKPLDGKGYVSVRQTISRAGANPLPVDYPMQAEGNDWKVIDIIVDGASLVRNYRGIYQYEINRRGLDKFIQSFPECAR